MAPSLHIRTSPNLLIILCNIKVYLISKNVTHGTVGLFLVPSVVSCLSVCVRSDICFWLKVTGRKTHRPTFRKGHSLQEATAVTWQPSGSSASLGWASSGVSTVGSAVNPGTGELWGHALLPVAFPLLSHRSESKECLPDKTVLPTSLTGPLQIKAVLLVVQNQKRQRQLVESKVIFLKIIL